MKRYFARPGSQFKLKDVSPDETGGFDDTPEGEEEARKKTKRYVEKLDDLQERLYAGANRSLLIVLQGTDTSGKDGVIEKVMSGINPQGCRVSSFKTPTHQEAAHDFLWRVHREAPPKGFIGIFNRSHYEDIIVPRVHGALSDGVLEERFGHINDFERLLDENGTVVLKFFLHISKDEQRKRLQARADDPKKQWKFNVTDLNERKYWKDYQTAFQDMIRKTSTKRAIWTVVPANRKWFRNYLVAKIVVKTLEDMKLRYPPGPPGIDFKKLRIR